MVDKLPPITDKLNAALLIKIHNNLIDLNEKVEEMRLKEIREKSTYRDYNRYDVNHTITNATPNDPNDFDSPIYDRERIFETLERNNAPRIEVANDGADNLYVLVSHSGGVIYSHEALVRPGDVKRYKDVYELRLRSPTAGLPYRVTEYDLDTHPSVVNIRPLTCDDEIDVCDRAARLLGIVNSITNPVDISDRCARLLGQLCVAGSPIDPRAIRALTFLTDSVDVSGSTVTLAGGAIDVSDRCARLLGQLCFGGIAIDPRSRNWDLNFITDQVDVTGSTVTATITGTPTVDVTDRVGRLLGVVNSITNPVDVSDRAARLLGAVYGSQGQQFLQRAATFDLQTQLRTAGAEYDARQVRALTSADIVTAYGSNTVALQQRVATNELLVQLASTGIEIDPRQIRNLVFATDKVDVTGSTVTVTSFPAIPIIDYNTVTGLGAGSSGFHNYVTTGSFKLSSVEVSASGALKIEVRTGNVGFETTKMVAFTTESNLTAQLNFNEELQLTVGQRLQIVVTNRELQPLDVYSTVLGFNV